MVDAMFDKWVEARSSAYTILDSEFRRVMHQEGAEQVLQGDVLVPALAGVGDGRLEGLLQFLGNGHHRHSGSIVQRRGYSASRARVITFSALCSAISFV